jgi:cytochrome c-type biogenesis protein CcmH/NrfG
LKNEIVQAQSLLQNSPSQPDKAISILKKYKGYQGQGSWVVFFLLGIAHMQKEEHKQAVKSFQSARKKGGENLEVLHLLSESLISQKEYQKAEEIIAKILNKKENHAKAWKNLGVIYSAQDKYEEAFRALSKSNVFDPSDLETASLAGEVNLKNGKLDDAWKAYDAIMGLEQYSMVAHLGKAKTLLRLKEYDKAIEFLKTAEQIDPVNKEVQILIAEIYLETHQTENAKDRVIQLINRDSADFKSRILLAKCFTVDEDYLRSEEELLLALRDGADPMDILPFYGNAVYQNENYSKQEKNGLLTQVVNKFPVNEVLTYIPEPNQPLDNRPLNIGFLSNDFWDTPNGRMYLELFKYLPKNQFHLFAFASNRENDAISRKISEESEQFKFIFKTSPVEIREQIIKRKIDILIDCTTSYDELIHKTILRKPAPIVLKWLKNATNPLEFNKIDFLLTSSENKSRKESVTDLPEIVLPEVFEANLERTAVHFSKALNEVWYQSVISKSETSKSENIIIESASSEDLELNRRANHLIEKSEENSSKLIPDSFWDGVNTNELADNTVKTTSKFFNDDFTPELLNQIVEETSERLIEYPTDNRAFFVQARALQAMPPVNEIMTDIHSELDEHLKMKSWWFKRAIYNYWFDKVEWLKNDYGIKVSAIVISNKFKKRSVENLRRLSAQLNGIGEIVFVNNGREDSEFEELMPFVTTHVKANGNSGAYLARNLGSIFARGEYLIFVDDDGIPDENFINAHLN